MVWLLMKRVCPGSECVRTCLNCCGSVMLVVGREFQTFIVLRKRTILTILDDVVVDDIDCFLWERRD